MRAFVISVTCLAVTTPLLSQNLQAALIALEPIEASWVNAPPGTMGATDTYPPGLLTSASVAAPIGNPIAEFDVGLTESNGAWTMTASTEVVLGVPGGLYETHADLLLVLWAATPTVVAIDIEANHLGDSPQLFGFGVDVDADGSNEITIFNAMLTNRRYATLEIGNDLRLIRIRSDNAPFSPQTYSLELHAQEWQPEGSPAAPDCGTQSRLQGTFGPVFATNHQLALLPSSTPNTLGKLVAHGLGSFSLFLVSDQPSQMPLMLPPPFSGSCPILTNITAADPGMALGTWPGWVGSPIVDTDWQLEVPTLPAGLVLFVQHGSVNDVAPVSFGTSNVIRIDT